MFSKKISNLINLIIFLLCFSLYLLIGVRACFLFNENLFLTIFLILVGLIVNIFLSSLLHELGHIIVGLFCGLKVLTLTVCFIKIYFSPKFKIELVRFSFFGYTDFLPNTVENYSKKVVYTTFGGLILSTLYFIFGLVISYVFTGNLILFTLFGMQYLVSLYLLLINELPYIEYSDGSFLYQYFTNLNYRKIIENSFSVDALILLGVEPKDVNSKYLIDYYTDYSYFSVKIIYARYLASLYVSEEKAFSELLKISNLDKLPNALYDQIFKELFFFAIIKGDEKFIKNNEEVFEYLLKDFTSPSDYRIYASYKIYQKDYGWAKSILKGGIENLDGYLEKGLVSLEKGILTQMLSEF